MRAAVEDIVHYVGLGHISSFYVRSGQGVSNIIVRLLSNFLLLVPLLSSWVAYRLVSGVEIMHSTIVEQFFVNSTKTHVSSTFEYMWI